MFKQKYQLEAKSEKRLYQFLCEPDSPYSEIYQALHGMLNFVFDEMKKLEEQEKKDSEEKESKPEDPEPKENDVG